MLKNKDLLKEDHINLGCNYLAFEYFDKKDDNYHVYFNSERFAVGFHPSNKVHSIKDANARNVPPFTIGVGYVIKINGNYLLHKKNNVWTITAGGRASEKPSETGIKETIEELSIILKNSDNEFELLFLGDLKDKSQKTLAECVNEPYRSILTRFYKPDIKEMELPNNAYFYMTNHFFDSIKNCLICINPDNGVMDIIKVIDIKLPDDREIHSMLHHENESGSVEVVDEKDLRKVITNENSSYFLKELLNHI